MNLNKKNCMLTPKRQRKRRKAKKLKKKFKKNLNLKRKENNLIDYIIFILNFK
jgi:hypothetical protein